MKKWLINLVLASLGLVFLAACGGGDSQKSVVTNGSTSMEKVIGVLGEAFKADNPDIEFTYDPTGSGSGITAVKEGTADIGLASRELKDDEAETLEATVLALDGIAIVVHKDNPVKDLTTEQITAIYKGEISNWKEVGGDDQEIVLIGREAGSGTRDGFESVLEIEDQAKYRQELTSTGDVLTTVASNTNAIGYASVASVTDEVQALSVGGIEPTDETIKDGSYVIQRPFNLVTKKGEELTEEAQKFFDYITSPEANKLITKAGVVPVND